MAACLSCGADNSATTRVRADSSAPRDGAFAVCYYCGAVAVFCDGGRALREPSAHERERMTADPLLCLMVARITIGKNLRGRGRP
jgi:hypothetical protein